MSEYFYIINKKNVDITNAINILLIIYFPISLPFNFKIKAIYL